MRLVIFAFVIAVLLLILRTMGVRSLSKGELAELEAIKCPQCRINMETIMAVCGLIRGFQRLMKEGRNRSRSILTYRAKRLTKHISSGTNKGAASPS